MLMAGSLKYAKILLYRDFRIISLFYFFLLHFILNVREAVGASAKLHRNNKYSAIFLREKHYSPWKNVIYFYTEITVKRTLRKIHLVSNKTIINRYCAITVFE